MNIKNIKTLVYFGLVLEIVFLLLLIILTAIELTDPINTGHLPLMSYFVATLQVITLIVLSFLLYKNRKSVKKAAIIAVVGGVASLVLFCIHEFIVLSVCFN